MPVERGIALLTGMDIVDIPTSTGHLDVDYPVWVKVLLDALNRYDGLYIHIKGLDEPGHDGDFVKKKEIIEMIDKLFFANLISEIALNDFIVCVTADHSTPCFKKAHSQGPLPLVICGAGILPDGSLSFSERPLSLALRRAARQPGNAPPCKICQPGVIMDYDVIIIGAGMPASKRV